MNNKSRVFLGVKRSIQNTHRLNSENTSVSPKNNLITLNPSDLSTIDETRAECIDEGLTHTILYTPRNNPNLNSVNTPRRSFRGLNRSSSNHLMPSRTSTLSPVKSQDFKFDEEKMIEEPFPIDSSSAVRLYGTIFTEFEMEEINNYEIIYYLNLSRTKRLKVFQDDNGGYRAEKQEHIAYRYEIVDTLGQGSFGLVLKCLDHKHHEIVAIKIVRKPHMYRKLGEIENSILQDLAHDDLDDTKCIIKVKDSFYFRGHLCIVEELLSINLYQFLRKHDLKGIDLSLVKRIATQLLIAIKYIHSKDYIHCDLKPENILLRQENKSSIKVIDFGSASKIGGKLFSYLQSRYYRAPEVILGIKYSQQIDI